ncbi:hypothetical protein Tco_0036526, partial [Tanacetum coccineum]
VDAYDSDCDDEATTNAIFMANLSLAGLPNDDTIGPTYDSNTLSEVPHYDTYHDDDVLNSDIQETKYAELTSDSNVISNVISYAEYMVTIKDEDAHYVPLPVQDKNMMVFVIEQMKSQVEKCTTVNQEAKSVNESLTCELEKYKARVKTLESGYNSK